MATAVQKIVLSSSRDIPFNKLVLSQSNVRRVKAGVSIDDLAASIARRGLIQSLSVFPVVDAEGVETGIFEVPAGGRRFRALELLVKQKRLAKAAPVPCVVRDRDGAVLPEEVSLAENIERAPLHPLDQLRAFHDMLNKGVTEEEIAAAFFVPVNVVKQRLRLATVSPTLHDVYAEDGMTLEQLMAFTVSNDHARQEQVWDAVKDAWSKEPYQIRRMLTETTVRASDKRAVFVGVEAYQAAGGITMRDLFQSDDGGWLQDVGLLDRLVADKLKAEAEVIAAEGWKWIEVAVSFPYDAVRGLHQVPGAPIDLSADEQATIEALTAEQARLEAEYQDADELPDEVDERMGEIETALAAFDDRPEHFDPADIAIAGVFVSIDANGSLSVDRGFVRPEDVPQVRTDGEEESKTDTESDGTASPSVQRAVIAIGGQPAESEDDEDDSIKPLPERLVIELTAYRTLALRNAVAENPHIAMIGAACASAHSQEYHRLGAMCAGFVMTDEHDFRIRPGRIRSTSAQRARPFIAQALAAAQRAGGSISRQGKIGSGARSRFGRGQCASIQANRLITARSRGAMIKARVVRHGGRAAPLATHLNYLQRDGVTRDGEKARLFGPGGDGVDAKVFAERSDDDRHHFRFIVSPDDALEMSDFKGFTRELVGQMEKDLGTKLEWVAVDHWNTEHPHVHLIVRGVRDDGENLVIARDYIKEGMRDRARDLITQELGPRTDQEIRQTLERQIDADRWTNLDRQLARDAYRSGVIDLAPHADRQPDEFHALKIGRLRKLEGLGLADEIGRGQWTISDKAETTLRELGERGDIIKRIHHGLTERGIERGAASYVLASESLNDPVIGRLVARGLDDELKGTAFAVIDGVDGRTHHIKLPDLDAAGDSAPGSVVELRKFDDARGQRRVAIAVRSDLDIERQVTATGATWLDRQNIAREPSALGGGFGGEVRDAMYRRAEHLVGQGLAERQKRGVSFQPGLVDTLRRRELEAVGDRIAAETGRPQVKPESGEYVTGLYQHRLNLATGRFAMIDDGLGFSLVPWTPSIEKQLGKHVSGVARGDGGVDWSFGRQRGLGL